jgi:polysaccharide biosynthesis transport protein
MSINILWVIFKARFWLIMFTLVLTLLSAAAITKYQPNQYLAMTSLVLNFNGATPFEQNALPIQLSSSYVATQLDIITSQSVALKVVEMLKLEDKPQLEAEFLNATGGTGSFKNWLATNLGKSLIVEPSRDSRVVGIGYMSTDPALAAATANAFANAYINTTLELSMEPAARNAAWFDDQLKLLRKRLEEAQARLTDYQQQQGIVAIDERLDTETSRLNELSKSYIAAQSETYDVKSRQLGENHPEYLRAIKREQSARNSLFAQKKRFLEIKKQRDELGVLAREVETEQQAYENMLKSYYQSRLESQFNQTNIAILNVAIPPSTPASPNFLLNIISAAFLGVALGFVLAFGFEYLNRRIRTERDIEELLDTKLLVTL